MIARSHCSSRSAWRWRTSRPPRTSIRRRSARERASTSSSAALAMRHIEPLTIEDIIAARTRISSTVVRTPLIRLQVDAPAEIYLKLENLQPIGSFKLRGAMNAMRMLPKDALRRGVYTASAGNMAQGVAWGARELGIPCAVVMPDSAPRAKVDAVERLGAHIVAVPY